MIEIYENGARLKNILLVDIERGGLFKYNTENYMKINYLNYHDSLREHCIQNDLELNLHNVINLNTGEILPLDTDLEVEGSVNSMPKKYSLQNVPKTEYKNIATGETFIYNNTMFIKGKKCGCDIDIDIDTCRAVCVGSSELVSPINVTFY